jgi:glycosyltransferase involved in cell wall biosynthesis
MGTQVAKPVIVISAVNLIEGGTLSILKDCLTYAATHLTDRYKVIALVHSSALFDLPAIDFIELPKAKRAWLNRLYYEFFHFSRLSRQLKPYLWLSLHDITPNVEATRRAVYCHNSSPFYNLPLSQALMDPTFFLFNRFYRYLYKINIKKNDFVIVQQRWLRREFEKLLKPRRVLVARPKVPEDWKDEKTDPLYPYKNGITRLIYPAFPRVFKNFEIIGEAVQHIRKRGIEDVEILITLSGQENQYARWLFKRFGLLKEIKFIGLQSRETIYHLYREVDAMIFPSKLETWGMPLTEFKVLDKPILAADLPYAHETIGQYHKVKFFNPDDPEGLSDLIIRLRQGELEYDRPVPETPEVDCTEGWGELFDLLLNPRIL